MVVCAVCIPLVKKRCKATAGGSVVVVLEVRSVNILQGENEVFPLHDYNFTRNSSDDVASDEEMHCRHVKTSAATDSELLQQHQKQGAAVMWPHPPVEDCAAEQAT